MTGGGFGWFRCCWTLYWPWFPPGVLACPMCAGSGQAKDEYTVPILIGFILLTYIPFGIILHLIRKYRHWS